MLKLAVGNISPWKFQLTIYLRILANWILKNFLQFSWYFLQETKNDKLFDFFAPAGSFREFFENKTQKIYESPDSFYSQKSQIVLKIENLPGSNENKQINNFLAMAVLKFKSNLKLLLAVLVLNYCALIMILI